MLIAISSAGSTVEDQLDERFGRCPYFVLVKTANDKFFDVSAVLNAGAREGHGAGFKAAAQMGDLGVEAVITGLLGPNAFDALTRMQIKAFQGSGSVEKAIRDFLAGRLISITEKQDAHHSTTG